MKHYYRLAFFISFAASVVLCFFEIINQELKTDVILLVLLNTILAILPLVLKNRKK